MRIASRAPFVITLAAALLAGCNLPSRLEATAAAQTAAAMTVEAALTAAAPSKTPTSTTAPFPTLPSVTATVATASPAITSTSNCDAAEFVTDVTYPDGADVDAGESFTKTWRLKNTGTCSWTPAYALVFRTGESMGGPAVQSLAGNVNPGQTVDLSVALTAPATNGTHTGGWSLRNSAGTIFSKFFVQISVGSGIRGAVCGDPCHVLAFELERRHAHRLPARHCSDHDQRPRQRSPITGSAPTARAPPTRWHLMPPAQSP